MRVNFWVSLYEGIFLSGLDFILVRNFATSRFQVGNELGTFLEFLVYFFISLIVINLIFFGVIKRFGKVTNGLSIIDKFFLVISIGFLIFFTFTHLNSLFKNFLYIFTGQE